MGLPVGTEVGAPTAQKGSKEGNVQVKGQITGQPENLKQQTIVYTWLIACFHNFSIKRF